MKIGVVLVTYNRSAKLKVALQRYDAQVFKPDFVLVVDNCSTDDTRTVLEQWKAHGSDYKRETLYLDHNTGGAGGFYTGMEKALTMGVDWVWLSDDDAYPRSDTIENLVKYYDHLNDEKKAATVALCATVYNQGKIHKEHRNHLNISKFKCRIVASSSDEYAVPAFKIDVFSYVGVMIKATILEKCGLDEKDFFIYCDDQEHSIRLGRYGDILCVTNSIIEHDTPPFNPTDVNWGRYYKKRNDLIMIRRNFPFRYFFFRFWKRYLIDVSHFSKNGPELKKILKAAYWDAWCNRLGVHEVYRPGWKPQTQLKEENLV